MSRDPRLIGGKRKTQRDNINEFGSSSAGDMGQKLQKGIFFQINASREAKGNCALKAGGWARQRTWPRLSRNLVTYLNLPSMRMNKRGFNEGIWEIALTILYKEPLTTGGGGILGGAKAINGPKVDKGKGRNRSRNSFRLANGVMMSSRRNDLGGPHLLGAGPSP